jgi:hypothetical protein
MIRELRRLLMSSKANAFLMADGNHRATIGAYLADARLAWRLWIGDGTARTK